MPASRSRRPRCSTRSWGLLRQVHEVLLGKGRGARLTPGEFRRSQVWIGGTRPGNAVYVPPPANEIDECLKHFERFLHDQPEATSSLVKAALAHGVVSEPTRKQRGRIFSYARYVEILNEGMALPGGEGRP